MKVVGCDRMGDGAEEVGVEVERSGHQQCLV